MKQLYLHWLRLLWLSWFFLSGVMALQAQLTTTSGSPYNQYVSGIFTDDKIELVSVDSIWCDTIGTGGNLPQMGYFNNGNTTSLGLDTGLVMTTGSMSYFLPSPPPGTGALLNRPGYQPLTNILDANPAFAPPPNPTNDACLVKVTFTAQCDTVLLHYVFGSNEAPTFVTSIDDIFAAWIEGPSYATKTNVALTPQGNPVMIETIFGAAGNSVLVPNGVSYGDHSILLEARMPVDACQTYTLTLAIADDSDQNFDTGVFLAPLTCANEVIPVGTGNVADASLDFAYEDCADGFFTFFPSSCGGSNIGGAQTVYYDLQGTATNGQDYNMPSDSVTIPANQDSLVVPINIVLDNFTEGTETIVLTLLDSAGNVLQDSAAIFTINDPFSFVADAGQDQTVCSGELAFLGPSTAPPAGTQYSWSNQIGFQGPPDAVNPTVQYTTNTVNIFNYVAEVTNPFGCVGTDTTQVTFLAQPPSDIVLQPNPICLDETVEIEFGSPTQPNYQYFWDFGAGVNSAVGTGPGPWIVDYNTAGPKVVRLFVFDGGCSSDTNSVVLTVNPVPTSTFLLPDTVCEDQFNQVIYTGSATQSASYTWDVGNAVPSTLSGSGPHNLSWSNPGFQQVSLTVEENGCEGPTTTRTTLVLPTPDNSFAVDDSICAGELMQITYTGSNGPNASYSWNFGGAVVVSGSGAGPYQVFWPTAGTRSVCLQVSEGDCSSPVRCQNVIVKGTPQVVIDPVADQCFPGNAFNFNIVGDSADTYQWTLGNSASPPSYLGNAANPLPPTVTYLSAGSKTVSLVVSRDGCQAPDTAKVAFEVVPEPSADFDVTATQVCSGTGVGFTYLGSDPDNSQSYVWDFGPGAIPATSTLKNPGQITFPTSGPRTVTLTVTDGPCVRSSSQVIEVFEAPTVSAGPDQEYCEGEGGVQLVGNTFGGTQPYFYTWTCDRAPNCGITPANDDTVQVNPVGINPTETVTYAYFVTDVNGCRSNTDSVNVTIKAKPRVDAGPDVTICAPADSGVFLQVSPAAGNQAPQQFTYQWVPSVGISPDTGRRVYARPDTTTIYTVVATSPNGCDSRTTTVDPLSTVTVTVTDKPVANAGPDVAICLGESIELEGFASGAGPSYDYNWTASPGGSLDDSTLATPIATPTQTTEYTLQVRTGDCWSDGDKVLVTVNPRPTLQVRPDLSACLFTPTQLSASVVGSGSFDYFWSPGASLSDSTVQRPLATPGQTTTYAVYAASAEGCDSDTGFVTLTIEPTPVVDLLAQDSAVCGDVPLTFAASHSFRTLTPPSGQVNYRWYPSDFDFVELNGTDSIVEVLPLRSGYVVVEAVIAAGNCPTRDSIFLNVDAPFDATATADTLRICEGSSTALLAEGGRGNSTYLWQPATGLDDARSPNPTASPDSTTTYVLAISEGICTARDTLTVAVNPGPEADYFNSIPTGCGGLEVTFFQNAGGAIAYRWDFGDSSELSNEANPVHVYEAPGRYTVQFTAIGEGGCEETVSRQVIEVFNAAEADFTSLPAVGTPIPQQTPVRFQDASAFAVAWLWDFGDNRSSTEQNPVHSFAEPGTYQVTLTVTDSAGCTSTITYGDYEVFVPDTELQSVFTPNGDGLNDVFQIDHPSIETFSLVIFDTWGRKVYESEDPSVGWDGTLPNGSRARDGVYLYVAEINGQRFNGTVTLLR